MEVVLVVNDNMVLIARMWREACKEAGVASGEVYWSETNSDGDFVITVFDREGGMWKVYKGGESDDE